MNKITISKYSIGDLVLCQIKGCPLWPVHVTNVIATEKKKIEYEVCYLVTKQTGRVRSDALQLFTKDHYKLKDEKYKQKRVVSAYEQAIKEHKEKNAGSGSELKIILSRM